MPISPAARPRSAIPRSGAWRPAATAETDTTDEYVTQSPLLPNHGGFAAFYASVGDSHARELGFRRSGRQQDRLRRLLLPPRQRHPEPRQRHGAGAGGEPEDAARGRGFRRAALPGRGDRSRTGDVHRPVARRAADRADRHHQSGAEARRGRRWSGPRSTSKARSTGRRRPRRCWSTARSPSSSPTTRSATRRRSSPA